MKKEKRREKGDAIVKSSTEKYKRERGGERGRERGRRRNRGKQHRKNTREIEKERIREIDIHRRDRNNKERGKKKTR